MRPQSPQRIDTTEASSGSLFDEVNLSGSDDEDKSSPAASAAPLCPSETLTDQVSERPAPVLHVPCAVQFPLQVAVPVTAVPPADSDARPRRLFDRIIEKKKNAKRPEQADK
ncbi:hypothetical protein PRIC1_009157 [Phytophthora ramorum]